MALSKGFQTILRRKHKISEIISSNKKFNINQQDSDGMAALHQAALAGNLDLMRTLLDGGASVDIKDNKGMRPLHYATWQGRAEPVRLLLEYGSSSTDPSYDRDTPLHLGCQHGHTEVVNTLLCCQADPTVRNKEHKTPLDLACEFGRVQVVELLLRSNLCTSLLSSSSDDQADNQRTTCLHLASRNGHTDVVRLLLHAGVEINRSTLQGTCLHEAALHGKIDVVVLLLDYGVDVNFVNSYDQTALDIVNKFTTSRAAKDLKQILKEASLSVPAIAEQDYYNPKDPSHLQFKRGDCLQVLEQNPDGCWRGYLSHEGYSKSGFFSSSAVRLLDDASSSSNYRQVRYPSQPQQPARWRPDMMHTRAQMHAPPHSSQPHLHAPPHGSQGHLMGSQELRHEPMLHGGSQPQLMMGGDYSSVGRDESFPPPPMVCHGPPHQSINSPMSESYESVSSHHSGPYHSSNPQLHYPGKYSPHPTADHEYNVAGYRYQDGDVRCGSPCRDSPTNSNRNSAASTDSGRGGSAATFPSYMALNQHRLSGHSCESGVSSRQSYHSTSSSSSLGSLDRLEESGYSSQVNVAELVQSGLSDHDIMHAWLADIHFDEYYNNFVSAGYDMGAISRMTPEDLNAIGITKPGHRKRLKSEIAKLHIHDGIPDYRPADILDWLRLLQLDQYYDTLMNQGYDNLDQVLDITWEDLEDIGIKKLGHQKKMILAIDRLKRIQSGQRRQSANTDKRGSSDLLDNPRAMQALPGPAHMRRTGDQTPPQSPLSKDVTIATIKPRRSPSTDGTQQAPEMKTFQCPRDDGSLERSRKSDVVAIQLQRQRLGSADSARSASPARFQSFHSHDDVISRDRDDETPTNDGLVQHVEEVYDRSTESPSRGRPAAFVSPRVAQKPKPVAKIMANKTHSLDEIDNLKSGQLDNLKDDIKKDQIIEDKEFCKPCKPCPPPPPKRTNSTPEEEIEIPPCVKSLSERFDRINTETRDIKSGFTPNHYPEVRVEDVGRKAMPLPPAIAKIAMEGGPRKAPPPVSPKPLNRLRQESSDDEGTMRRRVKRNESGSSIDSTHSGDTLPFANENVGTIKQRSNSVKHSTVTVDVHQEAWHETSTMKRRPSLPTPTKKGVDAMTTGTGTGTGQAGPRPSGANLTNLTADYPDSIEDALRSGRRGDTGDVLNDIDNMLQDLTDELDHMLVNECDQ